MFTEYLTVKQTVPVNFYIDLKCNPHKTGEVALNILIFQVKKTATQGLTNFSKSHLANKPIWPQDTLFPHFFACSKQVSLLNFHY